MKYLLALVGGLLVTAAGLVLVTGWLLLSPAPTVGDTAPLTPADLAAVRSLLQQALLREQDSGNLKQLTLRAREIEQVLNFLLDARLNGNARVTIDRGEVKIAASVPVPAIPSSLWVNAEATLAKADDLRLHLQQLHVGSLSVPAAIADRVLMQLHAQLLVQEAEYARLVTAITGFAIETDQVTVSYRWQRELRDQLAASGRSLMLYPEHKARLTAYARELAQLTAAAALPDKISVTSLLTPMFAMAQARGGSAVAENRAALQVLAMYALDVDPTLLLGESPGLGLPQYHDLRLSARHDFAMHLLISAGVEVSSDGNMAAQIGQLKEQLDTRDGGTGFSFTDLAIDRTGARLGALAIANEASARRVQHRLSAANLQEAQFTPSVQDLPEFLQQIDFIKRFVTIGSPAYNDVLIDIEARIDRLSLFAQEL